MERLESAAIAIAELSRFQIWECTPTATGRCQNAFDISVLVMVALADLGVQMLLVMPDDQGGTKVRNHALYEGWIDQPNCMNLELWKLTAGQDAVAGSPAQNTGTEAPQALGRNRTMPLRSAVTVSSIPNKRCIRSQALAAAHSVQVLIDRPPPAVADTKRSITCRGISPLPAV